MCECYVCLNICAFMIGHVFVLYVFVVFCRCVSAWLCVVVCRRLSGLCYMC